MMYQDHLKTCGYCQNQRENDHKAKLTELGHMIRGISTSAGIRPGPEGERNKGASGTGIINNNNPAGTVNNNPRKQGYLERQFKLRELGKMIRG